MGQPSRESTLDRPQTAPARVGRWLMEWWEQVIARNSRVGDRPVFDNGQFPWVAELEAEAPEIRAELTHVLARRGELPNFHDVVEDVETISRDDQWKTFFLYAFGTPSRRNCAMCPQTAQALRRIPGLKTAFFSILAPGKRLPEHRGPYNGVLRFHLGLQVPEDSDRCWIRVGEELCNWREGRGLVFDDSFHHEVHNDTSEYRTVLFVDFVRPTRQPVDLCNRVLLNASTLIPAIRHGWRQHRAWEERFHGAQGP